MKPSSNLTFSPGFKRLLFVIAAFNGLIGIKRIVESFFPPDIYRKDFMSPYLMARAIVSGVDPYLPLPELARRLISYPNYSVLNHPTSHPPFLGLLGLPFGLFSYEKAAIVWLIFELICLLISLLLLLRWWGKPIKAGTVAALFGVALGWAPIVEELWLGQISSCLLLLLIGAWFALRAEKNFLGGAMLGGLIALKLMAWPIVIFLALRRKWNGVIAAFAVAAAANLLAMAVFGINPVKNYYLKVGPQVASIYFSHDINYSTWTIGRRLFAGIGYNFWAPPLWSTASLALLFTYLTPAIVLLLGLRVALKAKSFDTSFGLLVGVGILVSPIAWTHYLMLAAIPIVIIARRLQAIRYPRRMSYLAFCLWLLLSIVGATYSYVVGLFASQTTPDGTPIVPFMAGALTLIPAVALLGLLWIVWLSDWTPCLRSSSRATPDSQLSSDLRLFSHDFF